MDPHGAPSGRIGPPDWPWLLAGVGLAGLATLPLHLFLPSFIYLALAVVLIVRGQSDPHPVRRHLRQGFAFGFGTNLVVLSWLPVAMWRLQPSMVWMAAAILLGLGAATTPSPTGGDVTASTVTMNRKV